MVIINEEIYKTKYTFNDGIHIYFRYINMNIYIYTYTI